jgi:L-lactate dehydrogenase complex protein LldG
VLLVLKEKYANGGRIISGLKGFEPFAAFYNVHESPRLLENVELAIIQAQFGVAENGAVWVTDEFLAARALTFICQHLVAILNRNDLVASMHNAYDIIGNSGYGFGVFIAGPSKTADIEQSLVLGAHGPKTMTVFLVD